MNRKPKKDSTKEQKPARVIKLVKQANGLIEARYNFSIWEMRIFKTMISLIHPNDVEFKEFVFSVYKMLEEYEMGDSGFAYDLVREAEENLKNRYVHLPYLNEEGKKRLRIMPLYTMIDVPLEIEDKRDNYIILKFNDDLKPFLLQLQNRYTQYDPEILKLLESSYSIRIYELLKEHEFQGEKKIDLQEFKEIIGIRQFDTKGNIIKDTFKTWQDLKRYVIETAWSHINAKTDICFDYEPIFENKVGRGRKPVIGIHFKHIRQNPNREGLTYNKKINYTDTKEKQEVGTTDSDIQEIYEMVKGHVSEANVKKWLEDVPKEQILRGIQYTLNYIQAGNEVKNKGGFIRNMVYTPNLFDQFEAKKTKVKKTQQKQAQSQEQIDLKVQELQKIDELYQSESKKIESKHFEQNPELEQQVIDKIRAYRFYDPKKSIEENLKDNSILGFRDSVMFKLIPELQTLSEKYYQHRRSIEEELWRLGWKG